MIKLVIFDLDGVLVDACEWHRVALNEALIKVCDYEISMEDHRNEFNGIPTIVKLEKLTERGILEIDLHEEVYKLKQENTKALIARGTSVRQEKVDLFRWLKSKDIKVACFTNSIRETAGLMLKNTGIYEFFDMIVTNNDVLNPKPSAEGYLKILDYLDISASNSMILEDSPIGVKAAKASGCKVLTVNNPDEVNIKIIEEFINENFDTNGR